jgi:predicted glutamine amidotransferase
MCQLTLVNAGNAQLNAIIALNAMYENSRIANRDGCGIFNVATGLHKTDKTASNLLNLGRAFLSKVDASPVLTHVRAATATMGFKEVITENSHPFDGPHYILAHNGSLVFRNEAVAEKWRLSLKIDSAIFAEELNTNYTGDVVKDLQTTLGMFHGKFAFMIYHREENAFYVARGRTAPLYRMDLSFDDGRKGFVVNTEKLSLEYAMMLASNSAHISGIDVTLGPVEILDLETVYRVEGEKLTKVGTALQTDPEVVQAAKKDFTKGTGGTSATVQGGGTTNVPTALDHEVADIVEVMAEARLSVFDVDKISYILTGMSLLEHTADSFSTLVDTMQELLLRCDRKKTANWDVMCTKMIPETIYKKYPEISFPYFLMDHSSFNQAFVKFMKDRQEESDKLASKKEVERDII